MTGAPVIDGNELLACMREHGFGFFAGVPCSAFASLYTAVEGLGEPAVLAAVREDEAVAAAAGACLAGARAVVLMQNSGLGNALNAIASLTVPYRLGCLLLVSWRGFEGRDAPEHLVLMVAEPRAALARTRNAGTVFLGAASSVAFGDYVTGANHVLPTAGAARCFPGLSVRDFLRETTWQEVSAAAAARLAGPTRTLAEAEGLPGHALSVELRAADTGPAARPKPKPDKPVPAATASKK